MRFNLISIKRVFPFRFLVSISIIMELESRGNKSLHTDSFLSYIFRCDSCFIKATIKKDQIDLSHAPVLSQLSSNKSGDPDDSFAHFCTLEIAAGWELYSHRSPNLPLFKFHMLFCGLKSNSGKYPNIKQKRHEWLPVAHKTYLSMF